MAASVRHPKSSHAAAGAMLVCAVLGATALAQEHPFAPTQPGTWESTAPVRPAISGKLSPAESAAAMAAANDLVAILRTAPALVPPSGFQIRRRASAALDNLDQSDGARPRFLTLDLVIELAPWERVNGSAQVNDRDSATIEIRMNTLEFLLGRGTGMSDDDGAFSQDPPEAVDSVHGYPVFEEGNGQRWIVIRRNNVPFFAPVTVERYLRATIAADGRELDRAKARRAQVPAGVPGGILTTIDEAIASMARRLANDQRALSAMGAAERGRPARVHDRRGEDALTFGDRDDTDATAVVNVNPGLMSPALPRTAPQILSICIGGHADLWPGLAESLDGQIDWPALERYVKGG